MNKLQSPKKKQFYHLVAVKTAFEKGELVHNDIIEYCGFDMVIRAGGDETYLVPVDPKQTRYVL